MKNESKTNIEHGCSYPEMETKPSRLTKALAINLSSSTSHIPHSSFPVLNNEERKAIKAHNLQVEMRRSMAIEYSRRNIIR